MTSLLKITYKQLSVETLPNKDTLLTLDVTVQHLKGTDPFLVNESDFFIWNNGTKVSAQTTGQHTILREDDIWFLRPLKFEVSSLDNNYELGLNLLVEVWGIKE